MRKPHTPHADVAPIVVGSRRRYRVAGLTLDANATIASLSDVPLIDHHADVELICQPPASVLDAFIVTAAAPFYTSAFLSKAGTPALRVWRHEAGTHFRFVQPDGVQCVVDRGGSRIWLTWPDDDGRIDPSELLLGLVLGFVLRLRGVLCLHAASVGRADRAVLLAGLPATGKSTVAAALAARGWAVGTDDVAAVHLSDAKGVVAPGPGRVRVRVDALAELRRSGIDTGGWQVTPDDESAEIDLRVPPFHYAAEPRTIAGICLLEPDAGVGAPRVDTPLASTTLMRLLADTWGMRLQDREMRAQEFADASSLVATTPVRHLTYTLRSGWLGDVLRLVEEAFAEWTR